MHQTRLESLIEACLNTTIGFIISFASSAALLAAVGSPISFSQNMVVSAGMTVVSVARTYAIRRYAQGSLNQMIKKIAGVVERKLKWK